VQFVGKEVTAVGAEGGALLLGFTHAISEKTSPDLVVCRGSTTPGQMVDDEVLGWLGKVHLNDEVDRVGLYLIADP